MADDELKQVLAKFDKLAADLDSDPEAVRRSIDEELIAENGREWFEANRAYLDEDWKFALWLFGYGPQEEVSDGG